MKQWLRKHAALFVVAVMLLILAVALGDLETWRTILVVPFVLFLPGFGLTSILFKRDALGLPERLLLSIGLSVAITGLIGLVLNWTPWGLTTTALWIAFLGGLVAEVALLLIVRFWRGAGTRSLPGDLHFSPRQWILLSLAGLVTLVALQIARTPVPQQGFEGYTTLWIQPSDQQDMIRLGIDCEEFEATKYQVRFELNGAIHEGPTLELKPGESWEGTLRLPEAAASSDKQLIVLLYRLDHPKEVYRHAVWWLD